jgi:hypothetical protein
MTSQPTTHSIRESDEAFDAAIASGLLSADPASPQYAGHWMYMHTDPTRGDAFKNINRRHYIYSGDPR